MTPTRKPLRGMNIPYCALHSGQIVSAAVLCLCEVNPAAAENLPGISELCAVRNSHQNSPLRVFAASTTAALIPAALGKLAKMDS